MELEIGNDKRFEVILLKKVIVSLENSILIEVKNLIAGGGGEENRTLGGIVKLGPNIKGFLCIYPYCYCLMPRNSFIDITT